MWQLAEIIGSGGGGETAKYVAGTNSGTSAQSVTCGFRPKYIAVISTASGAPNGFSVYNKSWSTTYCIYGGKAGVTAMSNGYANTITGVSDTGFTYKPSASATTSYYFACTDE